MLREKRQKPGRKGNVRILNILLVWGGICILMTGIFCGQQAEAAEKKDYIKWVDFQVCSQALQDAYRYDVDTYGTECHLNWIELLACLAAGYGGDFDRYRAADMDAAAKQILEKGIREATKGMKYYPYYREAYEAVLGGMVGEYEIEQRAGEPGRKEEAGSRDAGGGKEERESKDTEDGTVFGKKYGIKAFSPIAKGFPYSHYDDFGASRSYGYKRIHLGHDIMGQVGTPI